MVIFLQVSSTEGGREEQVFLLSALKVYLCIKSFIIEWSRPFGLDVLVWGLDPIYNVFHYFF